MGIVFSQKSFVWTRKVEKNLFLLFQREAIGGGTGTESFAKLIICRLNFTAVQIICQNGEKLFWEKVQTNPVLIFHR